jgi:hypothetical protein
MKGAAVPVTAKLSKRFYDRLGEDVANELVEWFNAVDATYRNDLRELNELNFERFDAKVGQRFAEFEAKFERRFSEFAAQFAAVEAKNDRRFTEFAVQLAAFEAKIERRFNEQTRWFYLAWAMQFAAIVSLWLR